MAEFLPFARNIEEASALAQYFTLMAASRSHNAAKKKQTAEIDQLMLAKNLETKSLIIEADKAEKSLPRKIEKSLDPSKGQHINILF